MGQRRGAPDLIGRPPVFRFNSSRPAMSLIPVVLVLAALVALVVTDDQ
jgi:hypothetical protein